MFPLNLQRNIVQLDRQISLLENECKNMEMEKKKRGQKLDPTYSSTSKNANVRMKAPTVRVTVKQAESLKRSKRPTPPTSSRLQSTGSLPSHCSKAWCENDDTLVERKGKLSGLYGKAGVHSCQALGSPQSNSKRDNKCGKCVCHNDLSASDLVNDDSFDASKRDHVLLFPNSGGTIEVTVTQKPNNGKENSPINQNKSPLRKSVNLEKEIEKDLDGCKCQFKGQKWSEILCVDAKKRQSSGGNCMKNKVQADETKFLYQALNCNNKKKTEENSICENHNKSNTSIQEETFDIPVKLPSQSHKPKKQSERNSNKFEKEIQCTIDNLGETTKELKDPVKIFQLLVNQFQQMSGKDAKKVVETDAFTKGDGPRKEESDVTKNNNSISTSQKLVSCMNAVKHDSENLIKEKSLLAEELATKDNIIATMRKREEEYLSLISSLKSNLEKNKEHAQEGVEAVKQVNLVKNKLIEQMKMSEALKKKVIRLQEDVTQQSLENTKLKTHVRILQLEAQKHEIIMTGKEAEINRYKEEIQNFQRQIEEHLTTLKSNAQVVDIEKMIEAIMQQSQIFAQTDLDSLVEKDEKDSSRLQNVLMHSSPTSTKTSVVNSSWKQISSIHENDLSKADSGVIYLNDEQNEKNFFEMFGENSEAEGPKKAKEPSVEKLTEKKEVKNASSFTSCITLHEERDLSRSSSRDSLISRDTLMSVEEAAEEEIRKNSSMSLDKAQNNIDVLLKNMKLKFSKEIFETTLPSCTTEDYLDVSQISSISPL